MLGVPVQLSTARLALSRYRVPVGRSLILPGRRRTSYRRPWPVDHPYQTRPISRGRQRSLSAYLVAATTAFFCPLTSASEWSDPESYATKIVVDEPLAWFKTQGGSRPAKLMVYAHGGLNSEESLQRIRVCSYAEANDIYPLFLTGRSD